MALLPLGWEQEGCKKKIHFLTPRKAEKGEVQRQQVEKERVLMSVKS